MSDIFSPSGASGVITYTGDSTEISIENQGATALYIYNEDTANVVVVSAGFVDGDVDAFVPTSDFNGSGVVIGPQQSLIYALPQKQWSAGNIFISVAGVSASGNVYITPGVAY